MALKDLLRLVDDKLEDLFSKKAVDPSKARQSVIKGIDRTKTQYASTEPVKGRKWFRVNNNVVAFTPPFAIAGKATHYVPSERFDDYLAHLRDACEKGELDDAIAAGAPTGGRGTGKKRGGWSPERRAAYEASRKK